MSYQRSVAMIDRDTGEWLEVFPTLEAAAEHFEGNKKTARSGICSCCKGKQKTCRGFRWAYAGPEIRPEPKKKPKRKQSERITDYIDLKPGPEMPGERTIRLRKGDRVLRVMSTDVDFDRAHNAPKPREGTVVYVHPEGRFHVVEFDCGAALRALPWGNPDRRKLREAFFGAE